MGRRLCTSGARRGPELLSGHTRAGGRREVRAQLCYKPAAKSSLRPSSPANRPYWMVSAMPGCDGGTASRPSQTLVPADAEPRALDVASASGRLQHGPASSARPSPLRRLEWKVDHPPAADLPKNTSDGSSLRAPALAYSLQRAPTGHKSHRRSSREAWLTLQTFRRPRSVLGPESLERTSQRCATLGPSSRWGPQSHLLPAPLSKAEKTGNVPGASSDPTLLGPRPSLPSLPSPPWVRPSARRAPPSAQSPSGPPLPREPGVAGSSPRSPSSGGLLGDGRCLLHSTFLSSLPFKELFFPASFFCYILYTIKCTNLVIAQNIFKIFFMFFILT